MFGKYSEYVSLYFRIKYTFIANIVVKHSYRFHFKSFQINIILNIYQIGVYFDKNREKNAKIKMQITEDCDVMEQNGLWIRVQHAKII